MGVPRIKDVGEQPTQISVTSGKFAMSVIRSVIDVVGEIMISVSLRLLLLKLPRIESHLDGDSRRNRATVNQPRNEPGSGTWRNLGGRPDPCLSTVHGNFRVEVKRGWQT